MSLSRRSSDKKHASCLDFWAARVSPCRLRRAMTRKGMDSVPYRVHLINKSLPPAGQRFLPRGELPAWRTTPAPASKKVWRLATRRRKDPVFVEYVLSMDPARPCGYSVVVDLNLPLVKALKQAGRRKLAWLAGEASSIGSLVAESAAPSKEDAYKPVEGRIFRGSDDR